MGQKTTYTALAALGFLAFIFMTRFDGPQMPRGTMAENSFRREHLTGTTKSFSEPTGHGDFDRKAPGEAVAPDTRVVTARIVNQQGDPIDGSALFSDDGFALSDLRGQTTLIIARTTTIRAQAKGYVTRILQIDSTKPSIHLGEVVLAVDNVAVVKVSDLPSNEEASVYGVRKQGETLHAEFLGSVSNNQTLHVNGLYDKLWAATNLRASQFCNLNPTGVTILRLGDLRSCNITFYDADSNEALTDAELLVRFRLDQVFQFTYLQKTRSLALPNHGFEVSSAKREQRIIACNGSNLDHGIAIDGLGRARIPRDLGGQVSIVAQRENLPYCMVIDDATNEPVRQAKSVIHLRLHDKFSKIGVSDPSSEAGVLQWSCGKLEEVLGLGDVRLEVFAPDYERLQISIPKGADIRHLTELRLHKRVSEPSVQILFSDGRPYRGWFSFRDGPTGTVCCEGVTDSDGYSALRGILSLDGHIMVSQSAYNISVPKSGRAVCHISMGGTLVLANCDYSDIVLQRSDLQVFPYKQISGDKKLFTDLPEGTYRLVTGAVAEAVSRNIDHSIIDTPIWVSEGDTVQVDGSRLLSHIKKVYVGRIVSYDEPLSGAYVVPNFFPNGARLSPDRDLGPRFEVSSDGSYVITEMPFMPLGVFLCKPTDYGETILAYSSDCTRILCDTYPVEIRNPTLMPAVISLEGQVGPLERIGGFLGVEHLDVASFTKIGRLPQICSSIKVRYLHRGVWLEQTLYKQAEDRVFRIDLASLLR